MPQFLNKLQKLDDALVRQMLTSAAPSVATAADSYKWTKLKFQKAGGSLKFWTFGKNFDV